MKNVHKLDIAGINLPPELLDEDRGYKTCPKPYLTFANPNDASVSWQNDLFSVAFIADSLEVELEKNGVTLPAAGITLDFPHQPNAVGFMIIWREVLLSYGAGCYKVKGNYEIQGVPFTIHYGSFDLKPYSIDESEGTIRVLGQYNDLVKKYGINFKESNFTRSFRVKGNVHNEQPNTEHGNILKENDRFSKYRNFGQIGYDLETAPLTACQLDPLFEIIYASNNLYISDFNKANFRQYRDVKVVLRDDDPITYGEQFEERQLMAFFKNEKWLIESKYSGREGDEVVFTSGLDFSNLVCPTSPTCDDGTVNVNKSDGSLISSVPVPSGGVENYDVADSEISVNGDAYTDLKATEGLNIPIVDSNGDSVNTTVVGSDVQVDDLPCAGGWQRPADWLPMPMVDQTDDTFVGLHAVHPSGQNFVAFRFTTDTGDYQVDWGDGTVTTHASNTVAEHEYDYNNPNLAGTLSSRGYKQAMIVVTPVSGVLTTANFQIRYTTTPAQNQAYATGFLDCILSMPNANSGGSIEFGGTTVVHSYVERFEFLDIGGCSSMLTMFRDCYSLQEVPLFDTSNVITMQGMFLSCHSLKEVPLFDTSNVSNMLGMFISCSSLQSVPLFDTSNVITMRNMFLRCSSLQSVPLFDTINVSNISSMFDNCYSLQEVPLFDTSNVITIASMFDRCSSLQEIPAFNTNSVTSTFGNWDNCRSLNRTDIVFRTSVNLRNAQLSRDELVNIFNNLEDLSGTTSANINISGNWGATALTSADIAIATNKNWTVTT